MTSSGSLEGEASGLVWRNVFRYLGPIDLGQLAKAFQRMGRQS